jgi:hypothetical protein
MWIQPQQENMDMISIILPCSSICFQPLLSLPLSHNQMASPKGNHEDKDNKGNIDIPSTTSAIERKMLEVYGNTNSDSTSNDSNHG